MAIKSVLRKGDPRLHRRAKPVTEFNTDALHQLIQDMDDTMHARDGVGIAAPQIGVDLRVIIFGFEHSTRYPNAESVPYTVLINPAYTIVGDRLQEEWEGCLSMPGLRGLVSRHQHIYYSGFDVLGNHLEGDATDFHARVIQHECDHINGIIYIQQVQDLRQFGFEEEIFQFLNRDVE